MRDWFRLKVPCSIFKCEIIYLTHSYVVIKLDLWCFGFNILYKNKKAYKFNKKKLDNRNCYGNICYKKF